MEQQEINYEEIFHQKFREWSVKLGGKEVEFSDDIYDSKDILEFVVDNMKEAISQDRNTRNNTIKLPNNEQLTLSIRKRFQVWNGESDAYKKGWDDATEEFKKINGI